MGNKGKTGSKKGGFSIAATGGNDLIKRLHKLEKGGEVAVQRTVSDFASRAPAWVSKGVREHYGVDAKAIKAATKKPKRGKNATTVKVEGIQVDGAALEYSGDPLTPIHFNMRPKKWPSDKQGEHIRVPGQAIKGNKNVAMVKPPTKYTVKANIFKGKSTSFKAGTYLAPASNKADAPIIPFQRKGDGRKPVHSIHTLSVPQMTGGLGGDGKEHTSRASESIKQELEQGLGKRLEHHIKQAMK